ncbi:glutaredoxin [Natrinema gari JCM 14663]|uniref:Glutaredoxin n=2 Tax=Natrinema gari TaxID=419186 RepID=L9Z3A2_9EURY|nr:glutaredoxin [Natrinema gari JCM 14663]
MAIDTGDDTFTRPFPVQAAMSETGEPPITFYRLQGCPYCERVTRLLNEYDLAYRSRFVEPMHSDRDVVKRVAGVRTVPVVVDENTGVTMAESANIADYLEATYGAGDRPDAAAASAGGDA